MSLFDNPRVLKNYAAVPRGMFTFLVTLTLLIWASIVWAFLYRPEVAWLMFATPPVWGSFGMFALLIGILRAKHRIKKL